MDEYRETPKKVAETIEQIVERKSRDNSTRGKLSIQGDDLPPQTAALASDFKPPKDVWEDKGIIDVPVNDLPDPEGVESPQDFDHHITWEDAQSATKQLPEIQDLVKNGKTADDFSTQDQAAGLDYAHGKRRVYDLYYGSDPIRLDKDGDHYVIISGRHRIYAAKELGLSAIPAMVKEK